MEVDIDVNNLNPKYQLLGYDMNLVKQSVNNLSTEELLSLIPTTNMEKNTLLYTIVNEDQNIGEALTSDNNVIKCSYHIDFNSNVDNIVGVVVNTDELKLLDVSQLSAEIGFNPLNYIFKGNEQQIDEDELFSFCKKNKYDGYIKLEENNVNNNNCYIQLKNGKTSNLCPVVYLIHYKKMGIRKTLLLGKIDLYKKNNKLSVQDIYTLHTLLLCNISNLYEINNDIKVIPTITDGKLILSYNPNQDYDITRPYEDNKEYDINNAYTNKGILNILHLNYINLTDECELEINYPIYDDNHVSTRQNVDIYSTNKFISSVSNDLMNKAIEIFSVNNKLNPMLINNYELISTIPGYESLLSQVNNAESLDKIKRIFMHLEETIVQHINYHYRNSVDGYKSTVNFINIQYIKTTYQYLISKVMAQITSKPIEEIISIITNDKYDKKNKVYKFFNVDMLMIQIGYDHYYNHKKLYQGLFDDIASYKSTPIVKLKFLKFLNQLDDNTYYNNLIQTITTSIYDYYKNFLLGNISLNELEKFMSINEVYNFIYYFAEKYNINASLLLYYDQILSLPMMSKFNVKDIYNMSLETFISDLNRLKLYILVTKYVTTLVDYYKLSMDKKEVSFFTENVEKYLTTIMDKMDTNINYYDFLNSNVSDDIIRYIINLNTNDVMIDYLYNMFHLPMENKNAVKKLVRNKKLYNLFIQYLQGNITRTELKNIIYFKPVEEKEIHNEEEKTQKTRRKDEEKSQKAGRKKEDKEDKPRRSRRKKDGSDTESLEI